MRTVAPVLCMALLTAPGAASAQDISAAQAFVLKLYRAYKHGPGPDYLGRQAKTVFSPALLALMRRETALTPKGDVGALDGDPFCDCQDYTITRVTVAVAAQGKDRARADVHFRNFDKPTAVTLDLISVKGSWRVDDLHPADLPSLSKLLTDSIAQNAPKR